MAEPPKWIVPIYFVIDESDSMARTAAQLQDGLDTLLDALHEAPDASAIAHVGVVGFANDAYVHQPLTDWSDVAEAPRLRIPVGTASYRSAFELLRHTVEDDVDALKAGGERVLRPMVLFFSDGKPDADEDWESAHAALTSSEFAYRPHLLAFGVGDPDPRVIARIATSNAFAFTVEQGENIGLTLSQWMEAAGSQERGDDPDEPMSGQPDREPVPPSEPQGPIFPIYLAIDESSLLSGHEQLLKHGLDTLLDALHEAPDASAIAHVGMAGFADGAHVRQPLVDWAELAAAPTLQLGGTTSYRSAFELLRDTIEDDVEALKASNYRVLRPAVFFLSDGKPNSEDWESAHAALTSPEFSYRPNLLAFGISEAKQDIIARVATRPEYAFMVDQGMSTGAALLEFFEALTRSVVASGSALAAGDSQAELQVAKPDGFINIGLEEM